jgi:aspartate aminotransferase
MFDTIQPAPADPILGLTDAFRADPNPNKINLGVGVYQDAAGKTPVLTSVATAAQRVLDAHPSMSYLPIPGLPEYAAGVQSLLFGEGHEVVTSGRAKTAQTPGGTGALRVTGDFIGSNLSGSTMWVTDPTWPNHPSIFQAAGVSMAKFPYFDPKTNALAWSDMIAALNEVPTGDAVLLHACCHNPTGVDPTPDEWRQIADLLNSRGILPVLDFAYRGFGDGIEEDAAAIRLFAELGGEFVVCSSFSKNFGMYCERVGAVTFVAKTAKEADIVSSQVKRAIRANYSNPPAFGARVVATVLGDATLRSEWEQELSTMRDRINGMRTLLVDKLAEKGVPGDFSFIKSQRGMFSFSGLTKEHVHALRDRYAIYMVDSGRINVAGISESNVDPLTEAIADVVRG